MLKLPGSNVNFTNSCNTCHCTACSSNAHVKIFSKLQQIAIAVVVTNQSAQYSKTTANYKLKPSKVSPQGQLFQDDAKC